MTATIFSSVAVQFETLQLVSNISCCKSSAHHHDPYFLGIVCMPGLA